MDIILRYRWYRMRKKWRDAGRLCRNKKKPARRAVILALWFLLWAECLAAGVQNREKARLLFSRLMKVERELEVTVEKGGLRGEYAPEHVNTYGFSLRWKEGDLVFYQIRKTWLGEKGQEDRP